MIDPFAIPDNTPAPVLVAVASELQCPHHQQTARIMVDPLPFGGQRFEVFACCPAFAVSVQRALHQESSYCVTDTRD